MNLKPIATAIALLAGAAFAQAASAGVVLQDDFNSDAQMLNWTGDAVFTSNAVLDTGGAIASTDLIGTNFFDFFPGNGNYVDLDGSTGYGNVPTAGQLESNTSFGAGTYTLTFDLGGNDRGAAAQTTVISLGDYSDAITLASGDPLAVHSLTFTTTGGNLFFTENGPSDQQGNILDNVTLSTAAVPEPMTWAMMLVGFGGMGAAMRTNRRKQGRALTA
jgi:predicted outer membrane repeat protein